VCSSPTGEVLHTQSFATARSDDELVDFVACDRCGMVFSDLAVDQSALDQMYEADSIHADLTVYANEAERAQAPDAAIVDAPFNVDRLRTAADIIVAALPDPNRRVLDAGCATGTFLGILQQRGFTRLEGVDPSPAAVATARRSYGIDAVAGSFTSPPASLGRFELITLHHVLEHIYDVHTAVAALRRLLVDDGYAYVEVPDAEHYVDHLVSPYDDFNTEHINHFSLGTLRRLLETNGFKHLQSGHLTHKIAGFGRPATFGIWQRSDDPPAAWARDEALVDQVRTFVHESDAMMHAIDDQLREVLTPEQPIVLWGAGQLARKLLADTVLGEVPLATVVDGNPQRQGRSLHGVEIVGPDQVAGIDDPIVIASIYHEASIAGDISAAGLPNRLVRLLGAPD
jgi:SAM-dependent methyltransferase